MIALNNPEILVSRPETSSSEGLSVPDIVFQWEENRGRKKLSRLDGPAGEDEKLEHFLKGLVP